MSTPRELARLARATTLLQKHGRGWKCTNEYDIEGLGTDEAVFNAEEVAALIDEVTAPLRQQLNEAIREADRDARDAYSEGRADESEAHRPNY